MRIAQVVPLHIAVPPAGYGGTERVVHNLVEALVKRGHEVTLFATGDSQTSAKLVPMVKRGIFFDPKVDATALHLAMLERVYERANQFDVIHSHLDFLTLPYFGRSATPTVLTLHGRLDTPEYQAAFRTVPNANYVSISDSQRTDLPDVTWMRTVHHGIDVASFPYSPKPGGYLAFVGRMTHEKRPDLAIEIAKQAGIPLKIAAKIDHKERPYFERTIRPLLDHPLIEFLGERDEHGKRELMRNALALLLPIDWPEPFGMVFIEALACGTPVITRPCGSVPELLKNGVTGYIGREVGELVEAARRVHTLSRLACRRWAELRFDREQMAAGYEKVYHMAMLQQQTRARGKLIRMPQPAIAAERAVADLGAAQALAGNTIESVALP
ncbi:MAG: glycosyltransferase family 4 protein [Ktedonobacterales bacterium]